MGEILHTNDMSHLIVYLFTCRVDWSASEYASQILDSV